MDFENETTTEGIIQETASLLGGSNEKVICDVETGNKKGTRKISRTITNTSADVEDDNISIYGFETPISVRNGSLLDLRVGRLYIYGPLKPYLSKILKMILTYFSM